VLPARRGEAAAWRSPADSLTRNTQHADPPCPEPVEVPYISYASIEFTVGHRITINPHIRKYILLSTNYLILSSVRIVQSVMWEGAWMWATTRGSPASTSGLHPLDFHVPTMFHYSQ
jgi:hypothetical protein